MQREVAALVEGAKELRRDKPIIVSKDSGTSINEAQQNIRVIPILEPVESEFLVQSA